MELRDVEVKVVLNYYYNAVEHLEYRLENIDEQCNRLDPDLCAIQINRLRNKIADCESRIAELKALIKED